MFLSVCQNVSLLGVTAHLEWSSQRRLLQMHAQNEKIIKAWTLVHYLNQLLQLLGRISPHWCSVDDDAALRRSCIGIQ